MTGPVLVVDDDPAIRDAVRDVLEAEGIRVATAQHGAEALEQVFVEPPSLVLLDMRMPVMDGFQVLERLRADEATRDLPIIFLTADHERGSLVRAFSSGAVDYITKPFVAEELLARVRTHVDLKLARDRLQKQSQERQESLELIAHDLRNHFTNVLFASELLAGDSGAGGQRGKLGESIRSSAHAGLMFLQAVLDQAAGETHGAAVEPLPAAQVAMDSVAGYTEQALKKAMRFDLQLDRQLLVRGQRVAVTHVLNNLISNAIKYAPAESVITVAAIRHEANGRLLVMDQGPGIAEQDRGALFRRYVPLSSTPTGGETATGLGLALAKQKARAMGGDLWYDTRAGGGACFTLELPRVE